MACLIAIINVANAQDSNGSGTNKETKEQKRARKNEHPNALTDDQRALIKQAEENAVYQRKMISFDPNLTPKQRREKILDTKRQVMVKIKAIMTPEQFANSMIKKPKYVEPAVVAVAPTGPINYENRTKRIMRTLDILSDSIKIEFYDNGAIDGDIISVFYNGKLIVQHLMLLGTPAAFTIAIDKNNPQNEIVMYAENLGTEPPNTALLVVSDGTKKYEVDVSSDLKQSGTIYLRPGMKK